VDGGHSKEACACKGVLCTPLLRTLITSFGY